jgi:hypothetical protein
MADVAWIAAIAATGKPFDSVELDTHVIESRVYSVTRYGHI